MDENYLIGSYILHSDRNLYQKRKVKENDREFEYDARRYFGQNIIGLKETCYKEKMFYNKSDNIKGKIDKRHLNEESIKQLSDDYEVFTNAGKIGSIVIQPSEMTQFMNLFRMIMEHFMRIDSICWQCGNDNIIVRKYTGTKGTPYSCTNDNCNEFWLVTHCSNRNCLHPIRKHWDNYYDEDPKDKNNKKKWPRIICPKCRQSISNMEGLSENCRYNEDYDSDGEEEIDELDFIQFELERLTKRH